MEWIIPPPTNLYRWKVGDSLKFQKNVYIEEYCTIGAGNILYSIGSFSGIASPFPLNSTLGRYIEVAVGCSPMGFRHPIEAVTMNSAVFNFHREYLYPYFNEYEKKYGKIIKNPVPTPQPTFSPVILGHDVWFGSNVTFSGGISVGTGAVIASHSVLTKNVPPYAIVAGVPATIKKMRFSDKIIEGMLNSQWWNYELGDLYKYHLNFAKPEEFLDKFSDIKETLKVYAPKVFYPLEYVLKEKYHYLPDEYIVTDHLSLLGLDTNNFKLVQLTTAVYNDKLLTISMKLKENNKCALYVNNLKLYIANIDDNLKAELSDKESYFFCIKNCNNSVSIKVRDKFLSAEKNGLCSFKNWNKAWEEFMMSSYFACSCLKGNTIFY